MPIYGYQCKSCEHEFDALQKFSDDPLVDCPDCGEASLHKQLSAPKFRLKGKGWYETDFKTGDKRNLHDDKNSKPADSSAKSENKSEPKAEKKSESKVAKPAKSKADSA